MARNVVVRVGLIANLLSIPATVMVAFVGANADTSPQEHVRFLIVGGWFIAVETLNVLVLSRLQLAAKRPYFVVALTLNLSFIALGLYSWQNSFSLFGMTLPPLESWVAFAVAVLSIIAVVAANGTATTSMGPCQSAIG